MSKEEEKEEEESFYDLVKTLMVHGPSGALNPDAPCMKMENGVWQYSKKFPKPYKEETTIDELGRVHYQSQKNGGTVRV